jgi:hypothetical protein
MLRRFFKLARSGGAVLGPEPGQFRSEAAPWSNRRRRCADSSDKASHVTATRGPRRISWPLLIIVASWSILLFCGFGILSRLNVTTLAALALGSFAIGSAIFLILELNEPYSGLFKVPRAAMQRAIEALG